jgi:hypothetical protein
MTMYLSNTDIGPVGAEVVEFIDYPLTFDELATEVRSAGRGRDNSGRPEDHEIEPR